MTGILRTLLTGSAVVLTLHAISVQPCNGQNAASVLYFSTIDTSFRVPLELADEHGELFQAGWMYHLIADTSEDGINPPSLVPDLPGLPASGDLLIHTGEIGDPRYMHDSLRSIFLPITIDSLFNRSVHYYFRAFTTDSLMVSDSIAFTNSRLFEIPETDHFLLVANTETQAFGRGGACIDWLDSSGVFPASSLDTVFTGYPAIVTVEDAGEWALEFSGTSDSRLRSLSVRYREVTPPQWNFDDLPLEHILSVSQLSDRHPEHETSQLIRLFFSAEEVEDVYNGEITPGEMAFFHLQENGWQEIQTLIVNPGENWYAEFETSDYLITGHFALAPSGISGSGESGQPLITKYRLYDNYPNPFNPATRIRFDLPHATPVTFTVYDILGRLVEKRGLGYLRTGSHSITFEGAHLSSGVYFYRVNAGSFTATNKMILLR